MNYSNSQRAGVILYLTALIFGAYEVSQADATKMMKQFKVSNMKSERGMVELRIIADRPPIPEACVVEPTLEDVFLYYFGEKGGETE